MAQRVELVVNNETIPEDFRTFFSQPEVIDSTTYSGEVVFHYSLSSILLFYLNIHPKLTQHKDPCLEKMLQTLKLLVFDLASKIYVVCGI